MICQYANLRIEMRKNMLYNDINTGKTFGFVQICGIMGKPQNYLMEVFKMNEREKELIEIIRGSKNPEEVMRATVLAIIECLEKSGKLKIE